jgi:DNA-binding TFAR19-related protein (PDSD5 family)
MCNDEEIEFLKRKKFIEMQKRILAKYKEKEVSSDIDPLKVLSKIFTQKAWEVFNSAKQQYPGIVDRIAKDLAQLVLKKEITEPITGEQLLWIFRLLGLNVKMEIKIKFLENGKLKTIAEKLHEK